MDVILIHGMGRTPLSMRRLARRLRSAGHRPHRFGYSPTFETLAGAISRLQRRVRHAAAAGPYAVVGHSLGSVLIRAALADASIPQPAATFLLAPPMCACRAARFFARWAPYRWLTGEMGQRLADAAYMNALPMPGGFVRIYAGVGGPRRAWLPFGSEPNDGILSLAEATGDHAALVHPVPAMHTFIMNAPAVVDDLLRCLTQAETQAGKNAALSG